MTKDNKTVINYFRSTVSEREQIELKARATGVSVSEFLRACAMDRELAIPDPHAKLKARIEIAVEKDQPKTEGIPSLLAGELK